MLQRASTLRSATECSPVCSKAEHGVSQKKSEPSRVMKRFYFLSIVLLLASPGLAQPPVTTAIKILRAEDSRAYDETLAELLRSPNPAIQTRAALAAGRIGNAAAIPPLIALLEDGASAGVRAMAAFAIGEIESVKGAEVILKSLKESNVPASVRARTVEAAGKIAAANAKDERAKGLGEAILDTLDAEDKKGAKQNRDVILQGVTAALRARPEEGGLVIAKFLTNLDPRIRADAANALARLRSKNANPSLRAMLITDSDAVARANAARALGAAEDKEALNILLEAATTDDDLRVRVSAIRALGSLKDAKAAERLIAHGEKLLAAYKKARKPNFIPAEQNEFIELAATLGRIIPNTDNQRADNLLRDFGKIDKGHTPEIYIGRVRIGQRRGDDKEMPELTNWRQYSSVAQIVGEIALIEPTSEVGKQMKAEAPDLFRPMAKAFAEADPATEGQRMMAGPDVLQAFARFKTADLAELARTALKNKDVQMRATAAGILGDLPTSDENVKALKLAWVSASLDDKNENDALLSILDALFKIGKKDSGGILLLAMEHPDYLVRKSAFAKFADKELQSYVPTAPGWIKEALERRLDQVLPYDPKTKTKLGQVLNTDVDYRRALLRRNGSVKAVFATEKGSFTINFYPEDAPLTVDNFIKLARGNYFNGLEVHRVVPNFVMQDGDPRGDGNGGPGWSIRCEVNMLAYERGTVGMALSGKDTGGSQWFVTHAPQPHLDGGYTVFGRVNETDMKVVDNIVRGDKIFSVRVIEKNAGPAGKRFGK